MKHALVLVSAICGFCAFGGPRPTTHDISVTITDGKNSNVSGGTATYTVTISNNGPDDAVLSEIGVTPGDGYMFADITYAALANGTASGFSASGVD